MVDSPNNTKESLLYDVIRLLQHLTNNIANMDPPRVPFSKFHKISDSTTLHEVTPLGSSSRIIIVPICSRTHDLNASST